MSWKLMKISSDSLEPVQFHIPSGRTLEMVQVVHMYHQKIHVRVFIYSLDLLSSSHDIWMNYKIYVFAPPFLKSYCPPCTFHLHKCKQSILISHTVTDSFYFSETFEPPNSHFSKWFEQTLRWCCNYLNVVEKFMPYIALLNFEKSTI